MNWKLKVAKLINDYPILKYFSDRADTDSIVALKVNDMESDEPLSKE